MEQKTFFKSIITLGIFLLLPLMLVSIKPAHAAADCGDPPDPACRLAKICEPQQSIFEKVQAVLSLNVRRTVTNMVVSGITDASVHIATGGEMGMVLKCMYVDAEGNPVEDVYEGIDIPEECIPEGDATDFCRHLNEQYQSDTPKVGLLQDSQVGGSLAGVTLNAIKANNQPMPVNMAYFVERHVENVPVIGTAYAQSSYSYTGPFLDFVFVLWEITRNIAYGFISLFMVVAGVMIMTRKRLNPQTMVTVQYALPRVAIAIVLITFSYAIGAAFASLTWALRETIDDMVVNFGSDWITSNPFILFLFNAGFIIIMIVAQAAAMLLGGGPGFFLGAIGALGLLLAIIIRLVIEIKMFFVYLSMIVLIIGSPLVFAFGAIPGNDDKTVNWFKTLGVKALSLLGMRAIVAMTNLFLATIVVKSLAQIFFIPAVESDLSNLQAIGFFALAPLLAPFILTFGYYQAMKLPKKLEKSLLGKRN